MPIFQRFSGGGDTAGRGEGGGAGIGERGSDRCGLFPSLAAMDDGGFILHRPGVKQHQFKAQGESRMAPMSSPDGRASRKGNSPHLSGPLSPMPTHRSVMTSILLSFKLLPPPPFSSLK